MVRKQRTLSLNGKMANHARCVISGEWFGPDTVRYLFRHIYVYFQAERRWGYLPGLINANGALSAHACTDLDKLLRYLQRSPIAQHREAADMILAVQVADTMTDVDLP